MDRRLDDKDVHKSRDHQDSVVLIGIRIPRHLIFGLMLRLDACEMFAGISEL